MLDDVKTLAILVVMLSGCDLYFGGDDSGFGPDAGIDAPGTLVYPCNTQHEACAAARDAAELICDWKTRCDPLVDHLECVVGEMYSLCSGGAACNVSPYDRSALDACAASYVDAGCEDSFEHCEL